MKKTVLSIALVMGIAVSANAINVLENDTCTKKTETETTELSFLPSISNAIVMENDTCTKKTEEPVTEAEPTEVEFVQVSNVIVMENDTCTKTEPVTEAEPVTEETESTELVMVQANSADYVEVKLEDLNQTLQDAINAYTEEYTVKAIAFNEDTKLTKVTLVAKADDAEKVVVLNEEGRETEE